MRDRMNTFTESANTALQLLTTFDPALMAIVGRSLGVSATACALACGFGLALGGHRLLEPFPGREVDRLQHAVHGAPDRRTSRGT